MKTLIGTCLGIATVEKGPEGKTWNVTVLGLQVLGDDVFNTPTVTEITISDKQDSTKLQAELNKQKGNEIQVSITEKHRVWNNNVQTTVYYNELLPSPQYLKTAA